MTMAQWQGEKKTKERRDNGTKKGTTYQGTKGTQGRCDLWIWRERDRTQRQPVFF